MRRTSTISRVTFAEILALAVLALTPVLCAQTAPASPAPATESAPIAPIAIVPLDNKNPDAAAKVTGALEVSQGKAVIGASGTVTSGSQTTEVILPHRGVLRVCASTTVKLTADTSVPAGETPGLMMAMDHGAVELSFATGRNSDILLTPDFRILIGGPGAAEVKVRLGQNGDTCVDNAGVNEPYVLVSSVFEGGDFRVQSGQRVMFQHGSLHEVVDNEKEPCGCPPPRPRATNFRWHRVRALRQRPSLRPARPCKTPLQRSRLSRWFTRAPTMSRSPPPKQLRQQAQAQPSPRPRRSQASSAVSENSSAISSERSRTASQVSSEETAHGP